VDKKTWIKNIQLSLSLAITSLYIPACTSLFLFHFSLFTGQKNLI